MKPDLMPSFIKKDNILHVEEVIQKKNNHYPFHWHDYFEIEIIINGIVEHSFNNGDSVILSSGNAYLMTYYDFHKFTALTEVKTITIQFSESNLSQNLLDYINPGINKLNCYFEGDEQKRLFDTAYRLLHETEKPKGQFSDLLINSLLTEIIISMVRQSDVDYSSTNSRLIQKILAYIHSHFKEDISLEKLSDIFSVSPNYIGKLFKKSTGIPFNTYINNIRLRYACNLISSGNFSVKEIAFASGYNSVEYFLYCFKKTFSFTPSEYRKT